MEKEQAIKIAKEIMWSLDSWVNLDCLYEPSYDWDGTLYDECIEMIANFILEWINKCLVEKEKLNIE